MYLTTREYHTMQAGITTFMNGIQNTIEPQLSEP